MLYIGGITVIYMRKIVRKIIRKIMAVLYMQLKTVQKQCTKNVLNVSGLNDTQINAVKKLISEFKNANKKNNI